MQAETARLMRVLRQMNGTEASLEEPCQALNGMYAHDDHEDFLRGNTPESDPRLLHSSPPPLVPPAYDSMPAGYGAMARLMPSAYSGMPTRHGALPGLVPPVYNSAPTGYDALAGLLPSAYGSVLAGHERAGRS
jgi:hypothetical protein